jgi:hypothetical protein
LGAAYVSGLLDVPTALRIAYENGLVASALKGKMVHTTMPSAHLDKLPSAELHLAAVNHVVVPAHEASGQQEEVWPLAPQPSPLSLKHTPQSLPHPLALTFYALTLYVLLAYFGR